MPVLCNHCTTRLRRGVPVTPKAMFKTPEGVTMHNDACASVARCQNACPYSHAELDARSLNGETYSVISFNPPDAAPSRSGPTSQR